MSGVFDPEQNIRIESTDDPDLAKRHGLGLNKKTGLYEAPKTPDAGQRDGDDVQEQRRHDALFEGNAQHEAEHGVKPGETKTDGKTPAKSTPAKSTGSKASDHK